MADSACVNNHPRLDPTNVLANEQQARLSLGTLRHALNEQTAARHFRRARVPDNCGQAPSDASGRLSIIGQF